MYATNFEFNGVQAIDMGLIMGEFDSNTQDGEIGCKVTFNTSKPININNRVVMLKECIRKSRSGRVRNYTSGTSFLPPLARMSREISVFAIFSRWL